MFVNSNSKIRIIVCDTVLETTLERNAINKSEPASLAGMGSVVWREKGGKIFHSIATILQQYAQNVTFRRWEERKKSFFCSALFSFLMPKCYDVSYENGILILAQFLG